MEEEEVEVEDEGEEEDKEDKEKKKSASNDTKSRAEILSPGIAMTKDVKVKALIAAYKTTDGKKIIDSLTGGKNPSKIAVKDASAIFIAAAELLKAKRKDSFVATKMATIDSYPHLKGDDKNSPDAINKRNAEFYKNK